MAGNGIAGLLTQVIFILIKALTQLVTKESIDSPDTIFYQTLIFFGFGVCFQIVAVVIWGLYGNKRHVKTETVIARSSFCKIFKQIWKSVIAAWLNFTITLALFPAIPAVIPFNYYMKLGLNDNGWFGVAI